MTGPEKAILFLYNSELGLGKTKLSAVTERKIWVSLPSVTSGWHFRNNSFIYEGVISLETLYMNFAFLKNILSEKVRIFRLFITSKTFSSLYFKINLQALYFKINLQALFWSLSIFTIFVFAALPHKTFA